MAFKVADRVREFSTTSGTADFILGGAAVGFQSFLAGIGAGNSTYYAATLQGTTQWEVGVGTVSMGTLTRDSVLASSNGGNKVEFSVGTKDIFCTAPADRSMYVAGGQIVTQTTAVLGVGNGGTGVDNLPDLLTALGAPALTADNIFTGQNTFTGVEVQGGTIDATQVGASTPDSGVFTTLKAGTTVEVPAWTTAGRPVTGGGEVNYIGFNLDTLEFEGWNGVEWASVGGSRIEEDAVTAAEFYPLFVDAVSGTAKVVKVDSASLTYNPGNKRLSSPVVQATNGMFINSATIDDSVTVASTERALSAGPTTVSDGATVTVDDGAVWTVV